MLRDLLLTILADGVARHGYALLQRLCESSAFPVTPGKVERELRRLIDLALVEVVPGHPHADTRRTRYRITPAGRDRAAGWLAEPVRRMSWPRPDALACRLAALDFMPLEQAVALLDALSVELSVRRECLAAERGWVVGNGSSTDGAAVLFERELRHLDADREVIRMARAGLAARLASRRRVTGTAHEREQEAACFATFCS